MTPVLDLLYEFRELVGLGIISAFFAVTYLNFRTIGRRDLAVVESIMLSIALAALPLFSMRLGSWRLVIAGILGAAGLVVTWFLYRRKDEPVGKRSRLNLVSRTNRDRLK